VNNLKLWIEKQETNSEITAGSLNGDPIACKYLYQEAKFSYINTKFLAAISTIAAAIETFLGRRIEFEHFKKHLNEIVGYVTVEFKWKSVLILSIITHHDYLRKGISKQLIQKIKDISKEHPVINVIRVDTGDFMDYAQQFYLSCGFQICGYISHDLSWSNHQVHFAYPLKGVEKRD